MSDQKRHYESGRGRPPQDKQWVKGQCGNPRRIYRRRKPVTELVDAYLAEVLPVIRDRVRARVTRFEAIASQLLIKASSGDAAAARALMRYREFASASAPK